MYPKRGQKHGEVGETIRPFQVRQPTAYAVIHGLDY